LSIFKASHGEITQETGRLAAMDLVEVNPALAKTEADLGRCRGRDPTQYNFQSFTVCTQRVLTYKKRERELFNTFILIPECYIISYLFVCRLSASEVIE
jgi:hypothetical protein